MSLLIRDAAIWLKAVITLKNLSSVSGIFTGKWVLKLLNSFENPHVKSVPSVLDLALVLIESAKMWKTFGLLFYGLVPESLSKVLIGWLFPDSFSPELKNIHINSVYNIVHWMQERICKTTSSELLSTWSTPLSVKITATGQEASLVLRGTIRCFPWIVAPGGPAQLLAWSRKGSQSQKKP